MRRIFLKENKISMPGVVTGIFEITEECAEYEVTGLGINPKNIIVCEIEFGQSKPGTVAWVLTDAFSVYGRYNSNTAIQPTMYNQTAGKDIAKIPVKLIDDGFIVKQPSENYPIKAAKYNFIAW